MDRAIGIVIILIWTVAIVAAVVYFFGFTHLTDMHVC